MTASGANTNTDFPFYVFLCYLGIMLIGCEEF